MRRVSAWLQVGSISRVHCQLQLQRNFMGKRGYSCRIECTRQLLCFLCSIIKSERKNVYFAHIVQFLRSLPLGILDDMLKNWSSNPGDDSTQLKDSHAEKHKEVSSVRTMLTSFSPKYFCRSVFDILTKVNYCKAMLRLTMFDWRWTKLDASLRTPTRILRGGFFKTFAWTRLELPWKSGRTRTSWF